MDDVQQLNEIVTDCKLGKEEAFNKLVDMYATRCHNYFYRLTGDHAKSDDLLSELFTRLVTRIRSFRGGSFEKWLFTIASNIFHDHLRRQYRQKKLLDGRVSMLQAEEKSQPTRAEKQMIDKLQDKLSRLDEDTSELLTLRFYGQLSFKELAEIRGEPIGTTLSKVHRGLKKLRELMEKGDE
jgi:RNA polymerase sigma-70 factor (ECF subfamily)